MTTDLTSLATYRLGKMRERVEKLERGIIDREAKILFDRKGEYWKAWSDLSEIEQDHYRTLAENELVREGLVRPKNVREMER